MAVKPIQRNPNELGSCRLNASAVGISGSPVRPQSGRAKTRFSHDAESLYMRDIRVAPLLSADDEVRLGRLVLAGDQAARLQMIESNLRLVVKIARKYRVPSMGFLDLVEEGNIGLMHAVDKFDPERGFRFSTYASWWIRHEVERSIMNHSRTVRLPVHIVRQLNKVKRLEYSLVQTLQHEPKLSELAEGGETSIDVVDTLLKLNRPAASTDAPLRAQDSGVFTLIDTLANPGSEDPMQAVQNHEVSTLVQSWLRFLEERPREIIQRRFGLGKVGLQRGEIQTLEQVAKAVGLTRERVRQIQIQSLEKLSGILLKNGFKWEDVSV